MKYDFEKELKELIVQFSRGNVACDINEDTDLISILGYNSIMLVQLMAAIEKKLGVEFKDYNLDTNTIFKYKNIRDYVYKLLIDQKKI